MNEMKKDQQEVKVINRSKLLGMEVDVYGDAVNPYFRAKDVANWIGHSDVSVMMRMVDDDEKGTKIVRTLGGKQEVWFLTENGLYEVLMLSRKPIAKDFKKGVKKILHDIRTNGGYMVARADETPEQVMARALMLAKETIDRHKAALQQAKSENRQLQTENADLASRNEGQRRHISALLPGATFAKAVETSEHSILVGELARIIRQNGVEIGQNRLFTWLRANRYLCKKGEMHNQPTQKALQMGLFELKKIVITKPSGETLVKTTTKVTGKGQIYFVNKFLYDAAATAEEKSNGTENESKKGGKA